METARTSASPVSLVKQALGPASGVPAKVQRLFKILAGYRQGGVVNARLARLREVGCIDGEIPSKLQIAVGAYDMLRFWISPAAADYYAQKGISYGFHQLLRFLEEPASLADPVGFFSERDGIIGHLMQVVHANPVYDLQLLMMFPDGLDELEAQLEAMLGGTHPRAQTIRAIVEEPDYHERLLEFVRAWRKDPTIPPLLRKNISAGFSVLEQTFGSLTGAMRYFRTMPSTLRGAIRHVTTVDEFRSPPG